MTPGARLIVAGEAVPKCLCREGAAIRKSKIFSIPLRSHLSGLRSKFFEFCRTEGCVDVWSLSTVWYEVRLSEPRELEKAEGLHCVANRVIKIGKYHSAVDRGGIAIGGGADGEGSEASLSTVGCEGVCSPPLSLLCKAMPVTPTLPGLRPPPPPQRGGGSHGDIPSEPVLECNQ